jgi:aquaporin Z
LAFFPAFARRNFGCGSSREQAAAAIGLALTLIHLIGIPVTNLSVNPARSTGPAVVVGGWALQQLWLFWVVPIIGASIAGLAYPWLAAEETPQSRAARA